MPVEDRVLRFLWRRVLVPVFRWLWAHGLRALVLALWRLVPGSIRRRATARWQAFAHSFRDSSRAEVWGYGVWSFMGAVVAVPEIWAAASGDGFYWPTISSTIGHLEDFAPVVAIAPVAVLVGVAYAVLRDKRGGKLVSPGDVGPSVAVLKEPELVRNELGRLVKGRPTSAKPEGTCVPEGTRRKWPVLRYFLVATLVTGLSSFGAAQSHDKWVLGYVLYSLIAALWIVLPSAASTWAKRDIPFTTLFFTLRGLERRLPPVAYLVAGGLAVLLIHLALYPWPDLARSSAAYAGRTPGQAEQAAKEAVASLRVGRPPLVLSAKQRSISNGNEAWVVYFKTQDKKYIGCRVVLEDEHAVDAPRECSR